MKIPGAISLLSRVDSRTAGKKRCVLLLRRWRDLKHFFVLQVEPIVDEGRVSGQRRASLLKRSIHLSNRALILQLELRVQQIHDLLQRGVRNDRFKRLAA